jgi:hypothetical protein
LKLRFFPHWIGGANLLIQLFVKSVREFLFSDYRYEYSDSEWIYIFIDVQQIFRLKWDECEFLVFHEN